MQWSKIKGFPCVVGARGKRRNGMATVKQALTGNSRITDMTPENAEAAVGKGLPFERFFTDGKMSPFDAVEWEKRTALIGNEKGVTIFRQDDIEVPKSWSQTARSEER